MPCFILFWYEPGNFLCSLLFTHNEKTLDCVKRDQSTSLFITTYTYSDFWWNKKFQWSGTWNAIVVRLVLSVVLVEWMQQNLNFTYVITISPIKGQEAPLPISTSQINTPSSWETFGNSPTEKTTAFTVGSRNLCAFIVSAVGFFHLGTCTTEPASLSIDCTEQTRTADQSVAGTRWTDQATCNSRSAGPRSSGCCSTALLGSPGQAVAGQPPRPTAPPSL